MKKYDHPLSPTNPYPDDWEDLSDFSFGSALSLIRPLGAVQERLGEDGDYILQHDLLADLKIDGSPRRIQVPRGLITDLTSVPAFGRVLVSRVGPWLEAAVLHDFLYIAWQDVEDRRPRERDRRFADDVFRLAMEHSKVSRWRRTIIYYAVRWFGGAAFRLRRRQRYADLDDPALEGRLAFVLPMSHGSSESTAST